MLSVKREKVAPLTMKEYARTFEALVTRESTEYDIMAKVAGKLISDNNFDKVPVDMLSIGAGRGQFEQRLVKELGLKLGYIYAVEPNEAHVKLLRPALKALDVKHDVDPSFFGQDFALMERRAKYKFDLIMFSHSLYAFQDPFGAIEYSCKFLKPTGKILIFHQGGPGVCDMLYSFLIDNSDPDTFNAQLTHVNHSLTARKIESHFKDNHPEKKVIRLEEIAVIDVDNFVRGKEEDRDDDIVTFFLQADYRKLSLEARKFVYETVVSNCEILENKYVLRHPCAGIVIG